MLHRLLRWILPRREVDLYLDCFVPGQRGPRHQRMYVSGAQGLRLIGHPVDGSETGTRLIRDAEAVSNRRFWQIYYHYNPGTQLRWEDGTPYDPRI